MSTYQISLLRCECGKEFINIWHDDDVILVVFEKHVANEHADQKIEPTMILTRAD